MFGIFSETTFLNSFFKIIFENLNIFLFLRETSSLNSFLEIKYALKKFIKNSIIQTNKKFKMKVRLK